MEGPVRVRVVFEDRNLLSNSQRMEGLKRFWLLLKPGIVTISDISHHLMKRFKLKRSCPDGILLSMDDFVLPPFESTCILKDKDIIRVRKKGGTLVAAINAGKVQQYIQDSGVAERKLTHRSQELRAITEFQEDSGLRQSGHENDSSLPNENTIHTRIPSSEKIKSKRKRKHSNNASDSKGKKLRLSNSEIPTVSTEVAEDIHSGQGGFSHREKHSNRDGGSNVLSISQVEDTVQKMHSHVSKEAKKKKSKLSRPEKPIVATEITDNVEQNKSNEKGESSQENLRRKHKASIKYGNSIVPIDSMLEHTLSKLPSSGPTEERRDKPEENNACDPDANGSLTKKLPTRSARRKKAKRKCLRGVMSQDNKDTQTDHHPPNDTHTKSTEHQVKVVASEMQEEIVPIVVRPGHIRFEPLDEEQSLCQSQGAKETVQWNGTTSKKKGQKWGRENNFGKSNDAKHFEEQYNRNSDDAVGWKNNGKIIGEGWKDNGKSIAEGWKSNGKSDAGVSRSNGQLITEHFGKDSVGGKINEKSISESWLTIENSDGEKNKGKSIVEEENSDRCIDYESLFPLTRIPQKGDLLVYRLVELSSSWCPEVSPFRVGKVSSYDPISLRIILVPVPEYPILCHEDVDGEESMDQVNVSAYKEDGSLEVLYPSLVDVRLLKANDVEASTGEHDDKEMPGIEVTPMNNSDQALADENGKEIATPNVTSPIDGQSTWEEIKQAISEKKAELQKNNDNTNLGECSPRKSTATTSWSYRGLRGSPMGPTLAFLRGNNVLDPTS